MAESYEKAGKMAENNNSESSLDDSPTEKVFIGQGRTKEAGQRSRNHRRQKRRKKSRPSEFGDNDGQHVDRNGQKQRHSPTRPFPLIYPMAPFNTTQFLMADRNENTPEPLKRYSPEIEITISDDNDEKQVNGCLTRTDTSASDLFLQDFRHDYQDVHTQYLLNLPKEKIVANYLELETKVENLEKKLKHCSRKHRDYRNLELSMSASSMDLQDERMDGTMEHSSQERIQEHSQGLGSPAVA